MRRSYFYPCSLGDHTACPVVDPAHRERGCDCTCHSKLSVACRLGGHALCDRGGCQCACLHAITSERVAARQFWAA